MLRDEGGYPRVLRDQMAWLMAFISKCNLTVRAHLRSKDQQFSKMSWWRSSGAFFIALLCNPCVAAPGVPCTLLVPLNHAEGVQSDGEHASVMSGAGEHGHKQAGTGQRGSKLRNGREKVERGRETCDNEGVQVVVPLIRMGAHCHKNSVSHSQDNWAVVGGRFWKRYKTCFRPQANFRLLRTCTEHGCRSLQVYTVLTHRNHAASSTTRP